MTHLARLTLATLFVVLGIAPVTAQQADQLYEYEFKEKESSMDILQDRIVWFRVKDGYHAFDALTGEAMWSHKKLPDFDGRFTLLWDEAFLLYSTKKGVSRLDVETGQVQWAVELEKLKFKDVVRFWSMDGGIMLQMKNNFALLDPDTGQQKWWMPLQPNSDMANKGKPWVYDLGDRVLILAKEGPRLIDLETGEVIWSVDDKLNKKVDEAVTIIDSRAIIYFKDNLRIVDLVGGRQLARIEGKVEETSSFEVFDSGGKTYVLFGFNKKLMAFDGGSGAKLWETAEGQVEGSVRWVRASPEAGRVLLVDLRSDKFGSDAGTWLTMHSIDLASGAIGWSQIIGYSQGASVFVNKAFDDNATSQRTVGWDVTVWFTEVSADDDNLILLVRGTVTGDPLTKERNESQGLVSIDVRTGAVNYLTRVEILHPKGKMEGYAKIGVGGRHDPNGGYPAPLELGNTLIVAGAGQLVSVDKTSGNVNWRTELTGYPTSLTHSDGLITVQIGKMVVSSQMNAKGKIVTQESKLGPYGFTAVDAASGQVR